GEIELRLRDAPQGFRLSGARIPAGRDSVRLTLGAPRDRLYSPVTIRLEGQARVGEAVVCHPAVPADDMMQAFAYRHLVPADELLLVASRFGRQALPLDLAESAPVRMAAGGTARVVLRAPWRFAPRNVRLELSEPPPGITLQESAPGPGGYTLTLAAAANAPVGYADNLIVEAFSEQSAAGPEGRPGARSRRTSLGVLPAIPLEVVSR
ncbi:MAG: hypothetical protein QHJ73_07905, partial [Armatimonadota bacterium]|nr:hypothetical protein [Armatimonadota bacterium]